MPLPIFWIKLKAATRTVFVVALGLAFLCAGCQWIKPLRNPDSLDNATSQTWSVTADFASGQHYTYDQLPESFSDYGKMSRGSIPVLTRLVAVSKGPKPMTCSLFARDISRLRRATPGGLTFVLYDDGIACLSTAIKKTLEQEVGKHPYTRDEYFRLLRDQKTAAMDWTKRVLGKK